MLSSQPHQRFWFIERFVFIVWSTNKASIVLSWKFWYIVVHQLPICWLDDFIIYARNLVVPCSLKSNIADMVFVDYSMGRRKRKGGARIFSWTVLLHDSTRTLCQLIRPDLWDEEQNDLNTLRDHTSIIVNGNLFINII